MQGGIRAWEGLAAEGFPEPVMTFFAPARSSEEYAALAWRLEEGTREFYQAVSSALQPNEVAGFFRGLTSAEEHHKLMLKNLYSEISGKEGVDFPGALLPEQPAEGVMEGGARLNEALDWVKGKTPKEVLEYSIALETNAYDRYLIMHGEVKDDQSKRVFKVISEEERRHIQSMVEQFEKLL